MIIIPDKTKVVYLIDSHPDTPEDAEYMEVSECDTIEITDKEMDDLYGNFVGVVNKSFSQKLREFIELKIAEKEKKGEKKWQEYLE